MPALPDTEEAAVTHAHIQVENAREKLGSVLIGSHADGVDNATASIESRTEIRVPAEGAARAYLLCLRSKD